METNLPMEDLRLSTVRFTCDKGHVFEQLHFCCDFCYGFFVLRSAGNRYAYLEAAIDPRWDEIKGYVVADPRCAGMGWEDRGSCIQAIYGPACCDPDEDGYPYEIGFRPICPDCGSIKWPHCSVLENEENMVAASIPPVAHTAWDRMPPEERSVRVGKLIEEYLSGK